MTIPKQTILITGATDGIGLALASHYLKQTERVILIGRRALAETPLAQQNPRYYCQTDLAQPECVTKIINCLAEWQLERLDLLIHNAGVGFYGAVEKQTADNIEQLVAVNLWTPIALTHALLSGLQQRNGKVVFISSVVSVLACPDYAVYGATKAALDGFARSLRIELAKKVKVQVIHPGATRTAMHHKSGLQREVVDWEKFPSAESVASKIVQAINSNKRNSTIGLSNKLLRFSGQYFGSVIDFLLRRQR